MKNIHITIINDCRDANVVGRQTIRATALLHGSASFVGVTSDLEAAGNLIDALDAYSGTSGIILVNVAPRQGRAKKWPNGTPFGYFWYNDILIVSSIDGLTLSLVKKLKLTDVVNVLDIPTVMDVFVRENILSKELSEYIVKTQFRSYDFLPRVAAYLSEHRDIISEKISIEDFANAPNAVWWVDNFGNCKTTVLKSDLGEGDCIETKFGKIEYKERLKDVPDGATALITGSSGVGCSRFLELVVQGASAADTFNVVSGDSIL